MCNNVSMFCDLQDLPTTVNITLGDGRNLKALGCGSVVLTMSLPHGQNWLSAYPLPLKGARSLPSLGRNAKSEHREGSLYYLDHGGPIRQVCTNSDHSNSQEAIWHRRLGHLGSQALEALVKNKMVLGLKYDRKSNSSFCESCVQEKSHRLRFEQSAEKRAGQPLDLVHSDVCEKVGTRSLSGCEYFVTFINDHTRHVWVYITKVKCFNDFKSGRLLLKQRVEERSRLSALTMVHQY